LTDVHLPIMSACIVIQLRKDAIIQVNLLFLVSSTCFRRCFRPSSGALDGIYSIL